MKAVVVAALVVPGAACNNNESVVASWPMVLQQQPAISAGAWTDDGSTAATMDETTDTAGNQQIEVWLFAQSHKTLLYTFPQPLTDCICRFGLPEPTLAFSADGQYLASGWPIGKGATPIHVYRVADATLAQTMDFSDAKAVWSTTGDRLYLTSGRFWSPEAGSSALAGASEWSYMAGLS